MDNEQYEYTKTILHEALLELKQSMDSGPGGNSAILSPEEATVVYRLLMESDAAVSRGIKVGG